MKFIHAADLHIDSPLRGLGRIEGAPVDDIRRATRTAFRKLIDLCLQESADLLLLAGDVFDGEWRDFNTGLFFVRELARLRDVSTQVVMVRGNHDAESVLAKHVPLPEHVTLLSADQPQTYTLDHLGLAVHGQSYATKAVLDNLAHAYPAALKDFFNIGLLHTNAVGSADHDNYAPCTVQQLVAHGYDYWALGHVHEREILHQAPWVVYPGNLQGRHIREPGSKGCTVVSLEDCLVTSIDHRSVDVVRWTETIISTNSSTSDLDALFESARQQFTQSLQTADGRPMLSRVIIEGGSDLYTELLRNPEPIMAHLRAIAADTGEIWLEKIRFRSRNTPSELNSNELMALHKALRQELHALSTDPEALAPYCKSLTALTTGVAPHLDIRPDDPTWLQPMLKNIESLLLATLATASTEGTQ